MEYRKLSDFLKEKFGERTLKVCVNGYFTCPNRDGTCGLGGCIFCSENGSGDDLSKNDSIRKQVLDTIEKKKNKANKFIVYFQNFTNTYDTVENLKKKYDEALCSDKIVALAIATRPDCINEDVVNLLKTYNEKLYVWVELGLQTINDDTAKLINRGYKTKVFDDAVKLLNDAGIDVVVHIMCGLPGEAHEDIKNTVEYLNKLNIQGIKIHSCYVVKNTYLAKLYEAGKYKPLTQEEYVKEVKWILENIREDIVIHRFSGDPPKDLLIAPEWATHKTRLVNIINNM